MIITLRELLSTNLFSNSHLLTGKACLDSKVTSIGVIDGPTGYMYTKPGMLVLTSGYFISVEDTAINLELINKLAACEVAGLAIKPENFKDQQIPQYLVSQADMLNFPLIDLQSNLAFRDFITFFDTNLYCRGAKSFIEKDEIVIMFRRCIKSQSLPGLAKQLHQLSGLNVSVLFEQKKFSYPIEHSNKAFSQKISDSINKIHILNCNNKLN